MLIMSLAAWWYGPGWKKLGQVMIAKLSASEDFFSIDLLLRTLFSPFRQISADSGREGTLQVKLQAVFDKIFSRFIGMIIRVILILVGTIWMLLQAVFDLIILAFWPLLPVLPVIGLILSISGWL